MILNPISWYGLGAVKRITAIGFSLVEFGSFSSL
jgi:hypothetical protein